MTPRTETVVVSTLLTNPPARITGPVATPLIRSLGLDRDYEDTVAAGYVDTLDEYAARMGWAS
ncbi:hypothetical protein OG786_29055 [Streptomyces sp. NBC_00101]|uniref:hypothetical protein n=1 Tax=Streptomyces sp. NBC_00101 TaxID=2975651 RepID=UPI00324398C6